MVRKLFIDSAKGLVLIPCITLMATGAAYSQSEAWQHLQLYGGAGRQIAVDPGNANHLFLAAGDGWGQYSYVTTNAGVSWSRLAFNGGTVVYDPNNSITVYLGKYHSADNGQTWSSNEALVALTAEVQAVKPGDSQTLFAKNRSDEAAQLFRSADGGTTWSNVTPAGITDARWSNNGRPLAFDPGDASVMYLTLERSPGAAATDFGIYKSTNGGLAWTRKDTNQAASIIVHPADRSRLLATGGLYESPIRRSDDTGETWQVTGSDADLLVYDPAAPDTVFVFSAFECAQSTNFGLTWSDFTLRGQIIGNCDAVIPAAASNGIYVCQFDHGVSKVAGDLSGAEERNTGIMELDVAAALIGGGSRHLVLGTERGVSISFDRGNTWAHYTGTLPGDTNTPLLNQTGDLCFGFDSTQTVYYVGAGGEGINVSRDGGLSWRPTRNDGGGTPAITSYAAVVYSAICPTPDDTNRFFIGARDEEGPADRSVSGLYYTTNGCGTLVQTPLFTGHVNRVVAESDVSYTARVPSPTTPSRLMYAAVGYLQDAGVRGMYWSEDSGHAWSLRGLAEKKVSALAIDALDGQIVYAGIIDTSSQYVHQILRSDDAGLNWTNVTFPEFATNGVRIVSLATAPTNSGVVYVAGMNDQLNLGFIAGSEDYGQTWNILAGPIERLRVVAAGSLYGAMNGGFYKYTNAPSEPDAPTGLTASGGTSVDKVQLAWNAATNATGYTVWRSETNDTNSAALLTAEITTTNYDDTTAAMGVLYYYWVKATNAAGASAFSASDSGWRADILTEVCADYDGDGKADPALYVTSISNWYVKLSAMSYTLVTLNFGGPGYQAVHGDFDGDGKADPAVYQAATPSAGSGQGGNWYVQLSGSGYTIASMLGFGGSSYQ
ncbi:MAG: hypothetical protein KJ919_11760, partial [Verrucomicrobia bacterium]|nr:hypothetical protein [Verrucomicrobiota bacterium]